MGVEAMSKKPTRDPDYRAAWRACGARLARSAWGDNADVDLRAMLDALLKSGWSIQALKAYASVVWRNWRRYDHVTPAAWRLAVYFASLDGSREGCLSAATFLKEFNENPERYTATSDQAAGMSV